MRLFNVLIFLLLNVVFAYTQTQTLSIQVNQSSDDAEESEDTFDVLIESSDLELVFDDFSDQNNQTVGIRFTDVKIPSNAVISNAYIQFHADDTGDVQTDVIIKGEASSSSQTFADIPSNISSRSTTQSSVAWSNVSAWTEDHRAGADERTPDLSVLVSEMITNNGWSFGNPLTFIITGTGSREAESFDGTSDEAPILFIEFSVPAVDFDLGIVEINGIEKFMLLQEDVPITISLENNGLETVNTFEISYSLNNGTQVTEIINQTIAPNESYLHTFDETIDLTTSGNYTIVAEVSLMDDKVDFNNTLRKEFEVFPEFSDIYFGTDSPWKYQDDGSDVGSDWINMSFDDSTWNIGNGEFGFGDGDEKTVLQNGIISYYFRKLVEIEDVSSISGVTANISADDAIVIYVNGQEIFRSFNLPEGIISSSTTPNVSVPHDFENYPVKYDIPVSLLNSGLNIIAVELHNASANNSDLSFSCAFLDEPITYSVDGPYVFHTDDNIISKRITSSGLVADTFPTNSIPTIKCDLPNGDSFSFDLKATHEIPQSMYDMPEKFLVTSDIEGQIDAYIFLLQNAGVIDENYNWIYGEGHLFFIGDMFDRGNYVTQCLWLLYKLESEAQQAGGDVHFIIGNHEVLNFDYDYRYVRNKYFENAHYIGEMLYDLYEPDTELGQWLRSKNILENAGNSAIFVHAGLSPQVTNLNLSYDEINYFGRLGMDDNCPSGSDACDIVNGGSDEGVYWYRGIANEDLTQMEVDDIITEFDGEKMIFGHSVFPEVSSIYDDKVLVVDVDHEDNFAAGFMEALYYENGCYYRLLSNSTDTGIDLIEDDCTPLSNTDIVTDVNIEFKVIPQLFDEEFTIQYLNPTTPQYDGFIYSLEGRLIASFSSEALSNSLTLATSDWEAGVYLITVLSEGNMTTQKAIKY